MKKEISIYELLVKSLDLYEEHLKKNDFKGICIVILEVLDSTLGEDFYTKHLTYIGQIIPELNHDFLNAKYYDKTLWWDVKDVDSRREAFKKLINVYKDSNKIIRNE